ncbi:MAG: hypothetical protein AAB678_03195, partial [Patescibacteria group bacterium]
MRNSEKPYIFGNLLLAVERNFNLKNYNHMNEGREQPPMPKSPEVERVEFSSPLIKEYGGQITTALTEADSKFREDLKILDEAEKDKNGHVNLSTAQKATKIQQAALEDLALYLGKLTEDVDKHSKSIGYGITYF